MGVLTDSRLKVELNLERHTEILSLISPSLIPPQVEIAERGHGLISTDRTTKNLLRDRGFVIEPEPEEDQIQGSSIELKVGKELYVLNAGFTSFDLTSLMKHSITK